MNQSNETMSRRRFAIVAGKLSVVGGVVAASAPKAKGDSPDGWTVRGQVYQYSSRTDDNRVFTYFFADVQHRDGRWGVYIRVERPGRPPAGTVVPANRLPEYLTVLTVRGYTKSLLGDVWGGIKDVVDGTGNLIKLGDNFIKGVLDDLKGVQEAVKQLVRAILKVMDRFSSLFSGSLDDSGGGQATARYALNVRDVSVLNASLGWKVFEATRRTLSSDPTGRSTVALAVAILNYDNN